MSGGHLPYALEVALVWSAAGLLYTYIGYPLCLLLLTRLQSRPVQRSDHAPGVSIVVAVHNEERNIAVKLDNLFALDYPQDRMEVIVASDCSSDCTDEVVRSYQDRGVRLVVSPSRQGKHHAQFIGLEASKGEIVVFTDAAPLLHPLALRHLMRNFADPAVGAAGGEDRVIQGERLVPSESWYIRYDMWLRRKESLVGSSVGLSGALFAVRRSLCVPWRSDLSSDFSIALEAVRRHQRATSDENALHYYSATASPAKEFQRKARTILNGLVVVSRFLDLLNPFRYGWFSWQLFTHKLCRWISPLWLAVLLCGGFWAAPYSTSLAWAAGAQGALYLIAFLGLGVPALQRFSAVRLPTFFLLSNVAIVVGWYRLLTGRTENVWAPTER